MKKVWKRLCAMVMAACLLTAGLGTIPKMEAEAAPKNVVVCIDPGHGGSNGGANYNGLWEKDLTLMIAASMYQELSQYEGVTVILTRYDDRDVSLSERAQIAAGAGADFLYSIHLNASTEHNLFGSEVWVSGFGNHYAKGAAFGNIALQQLSADIGTYPRGVKTKLNDKGTDYYSVIKHARSMGVTAAIIEHCYMDEAHDVGAYMSPEALQKLGKADATAVAKYYGLKSESLGVDYGDYQKVSVPAPKTMMAQDLTPPEISQIALNGYDEGKNQVSLHVKAGDSGSRIIYYSYSADGGMTWSNLWGFAPVGEADITITLPKNSKGDICLRVWNQYDLYTESNHVSLK